MNEFFTRRQMKKFIKAHDRKRLGFWAHSENFEKRQLAASYQSVCPQGITQLPLDGFL
jgi:hypothetical protein